jgi:hypothetical protein
MNMHNKIDFASYRPIITLGLATSAALGIMYTLPSQATAFSFAGDFEPSKWTLTNINADGSVDTTNAPLGIILTGGDNGSNLPGTTDWTIPINSASEISFDWSYFTLDTPGFDSAGYLLNGIYTPLAIQDGDFSTSAVSINVITGDIFGFRATTSSNSDGAPVFSVYAYPPAAVPEPSTILGAVIGLGFGAFFKRKLRS